MAVYDPAKSYKIINRKSGRALSIERAGTANGSKVILFAFVNAESRSGTSSTCGHGFFTLVNNHSGPGALDRQW